jgi:PhnB protein
MPATMTKEALKQTATAYLCVKGASKALDFYTRAFGAKEVYRLNEPGTNGKIGHAEFEIGNSRLMISDEYPDFGALSPPSIGGSAVKLHLRVENVDAFVKHAIKCGALLVRPATDQFFGERNATIADPFGHTWFVTTQIEDVAPAVMKRRWTQAFETQ